MKPEHEALKLAAEAADHCGDHIYTDPRDSNNWEENRTWHEIASPAAILSLLAEDAALHAQVEAQPRKLRAAQGLADERYAQVLELTAQVSEAQADRDKLLSIIAAAYQIAGAHDASAAILDVLSDPDAATMAQVDALLPYFAEVQAVPGWISAKDRLPPVGQVVAVYSPPTVHDWPGSINLQLDCIDENDDEAKSWAGHNNWYEEYCNIAKPEGSTGPSADAPYTHWYSLPAIPCAPAQAKEDAT